MKKYLTIFALLLLSATFAMAADFGDLLSRLDSRDFSAERKTLTGEGGAYVGETENPHSETVMFKARDEFRALMTEALNNEEKTADLRAFIFDALNQDISLETKVWLTDRLAALGTAEDVPALVALLQGDEPRLVFAAAAVLAKIPGDEALKALEENAETIPDAKNALLSRTTQPLPFEGVESVLPLGLSNASEEAVEEWLKDFDTYSTDLQIQTLAALTARDSKEYRPYALKALSSGNPELEKAGFLALEKMATKDDVDIFISYLNINRNLAVTLAGYVEAEGFDEVLLDRLNNADNIELFSNLVVILVSRSVDVRPVIFKRITAKDCENRLDYFKYLVPLLTPADTENMVQVTLLIPRGADHDAAENIVAQILNKDASPLIAMIDKADKNDLLPIASMICRTGGDQAKAFLQSLMDSNDRAKRDIALRALPNCADAQFADLMMSYIEGGKLNDGQSLAFLRAYIRVISLPEDQDGIDLDRNQKLDLLKKAYKMAKRPDEKKLILSRLAANRNENSLAFAVECVSDQDVTEEACEAIMRHAHDTALRKQFPEQMMSAINLVIETSKNQKTVEQIKIYKGRMEN